MRRVFIVEIDDRDSPDLRRRPERNLKRIFRTIGEQQAWGDIERPVQDGDGNVVGLWRLQDEADQPQR